jgi:SAM-dependent methyltransferase
MRRTGADAAELELVRLNWGCGDHLADGWINSDVKDAPGVDLVADLREGLPLAAESVDLVVSVHALPELGFREQVPALAELGRVLRPDGAIRLVLPDLDRAIDAYRDGDDDYFLVPPEEAGSPGGRFLAHILWFGWSRTLFTADFAAELLERAGFERVEVVSHGRTTTPFGSLTALDNRPGESLQVEGRKPRIGSGARILPYNRGVTAGGLEIIDVAPDPGERVRGHFRAREHEDGKLEIIGWAIGSESPATEVLVLAGGSVAGTAPVAVDRPDVAERFPDISGASTSGFRLELMAKGRGESQLDIYAVLGDESREPLGRIRVKTGRRGIFGALRRN